MSSKKIPRRREPPSSAKPEVLIVAHHHFRPGGVRRVIELALPGLARRLAPALRAILLVGGESPPAAWLAELRASLPPRSPFPEVRVHPSLGYAAEQSPPPGIIASRARAFLEDLLASTQNSRPLVWLHNPGLGRNLPAIQAWTRACARRGVPMVFHHHDWWFDNRWQRWPELRTAARGSLTRIARTLLPDEPAIRHATINRADAAHLRRSLTHPVAWIPNPAAPVSAPDTSRVSAARQWLQQRTGTRGPIWLLPCRLLRRKNIAEALLLTRWLAPEARLATTAGVSSADEAAYAEALRAAVTRHDWPLDLAILADAPAGAPPIQDLLAAGAGVLLTSLAEGFGLPYLEAAAAHRPLVARRLANIAPDLASLGFRFPGLYDDVLIAPGLFDVDAELRRQAERFAAWLTGMPRHVRQCVPQPRWFAEPGAPVAFSRLTLTAQIEVLSVDPKVSLRHARHANPWLDAWFRAHPAPWRRPTAWPAGATERLSTDRYAGSLLRLARSRGSAHAVGSNTPTRSQSAQESLLRARLVPDQLHPILWTTRP